MLLHTAQETLLLLLLGVSSNVFAYGMDKSIEQLVAMRARAAQEAGGFLLSYLLWSGSALVLCALSAACAQHISSAAVGSGIPQMKCVLAGGARIDHYLSARTLAAKVLSLVLAIGGGLAVGKEGPYVHISTCVAQQLCRLPLFRRLNETEALRRQMLAAGCAAGVAATFGAPVGGVLFSIEVTATYYSVSHLWKAMFTAVAAAVVFRVTRDMSSLALFNVTDFNDMGELLYNGEIYAFALLGVLMGALGAAFVHATRSLVLLVRVLRDSLAETEALAPPSAASRGGSSRCGGWCAARCVVRRALAALLSRYGYTLLVAASSAMLTFPFGFFRSSPQEVINELFGSAPFDFTARWSNPSLLTNLLIYTVCMFVFTSVTVSAPIACGVYTPVFMIGAAAGRLFGEVLNLLTPAEHQITAGGYAVVGAAAMAAGVTRTISTAVIVFELTGQLNHMLPVLVAVLAACGVGNLINDSFYDMMLQLNGLPFLQPLGTHQARGVCAQQVMDTAVVALSRDCTYLDAYALLQRAARAGPGDEFPVVESQASPLLIGAVRRAPLERLVARRLCKREEPAPSLLARVRSFMGPAAPPADAAADGGSDVGVAVVAGWKGACFAPGEMDASGMDAAASECGHSAAARPGAAGAAGALLGLTAEEAALLAQPLDLGINGPLPSIIRRGASASEPGALVDLVPSVVLATTPLFEVHRHFSLLSIDHAYVTFAGRLLGVIRRSSLIARQSNSKGGDYGGWKGADAQEEEHYNL